MTANPITKLDPITITISDQRDLKRLHQLAALSRWKPERCALVACRRGVNVSLPAPKPPSIGRKTVSFELPAEDYDRFDYAIRKFYGGTYYRMPGEAGHRLTDIAIHACILLQRDAEDLLRKVPGCRQEPKIIPFSPALSGLSKVGGRE